MPHLVHKYQDIEVGQVVTLNCGGPPMTVVGFVPSASPAIAPGIQNATYVDSASALHAHVVWVAENGTLGQTTLPVGSFAVKDAKDGAGISA